MLGGDTVTRDVLADLIRGAVDDTVKEQIARRAQGRGLGLYISRELAKHHDWQLYMDADVGLHRPGRLSRFVLDMGA